MPEIFATMGPIRLLGMLVAIAACTPSADGRHLHDLYLFELKKPAESKGPWDYDNLRATITAAEAWRPIDQGDCPLMKR